MAGWRVGFLVGNAEIVAALARLKSYLDYGTFQPIQIAAIVALNEARRLSRRGVRDLPRAAATRCCDGLARIGWHDRRGRAGRCSSGRRSPRPTRALGSLEFALRARARGARSRSARASGFGPGGDGFVRFALVENEQRIGQAIRGIRAALPALAGGGVAAAPN